MGARALLLGLACAAVAVLGAGCGGDDGLTTRAEVAPPPLIPVPELESDDDFALDGAGLQERLPVDRDVKKKRTAKKKAKKKADRKQRKSRRGKRGAAAKARVLGRSRISVPAPKKAAPPVRAPREDSVDYAAQVRATLAELERRVNARDVDLCTDLFTQRHVEAFTGAEGDAAQARCRWYVATSEVTYKVESVDSLSVTAKEGVVTFTSSADGRSATQTVRVVNADGWKFDGPAS